MNCGATAVAAGGNRLTCDKAPGHEGDHRGYLEEHDAVLFWRDTPPAPALPLELLEAIEVLIVGADALIEEYPGYENVAAARDTARLYVAQQRARARA